MFIMVDLPEPEAPMIAAISPVATDSVTMARAATSMLPIL
jgi:hypothetical protein